MNKHAPQKNSQDWHPADIKAALEKAGWSLRALSRHHQLSPNALAIALHKQYAKAEERIATALGVPPQTIWPSRYNSDGTPKHKPMGNPNWLPGVPRKSSKGGADCNVKHRKAA